ncbi:MAG: YceI family protein [Patescibacteria group bacterium]
MQKKIIIGLLAVVLISAGLYFYPIQKGGQPVEITQNNVENVPQNNNSDKKTLDIISNESLATYELDEVLRGTPTHVKGATSDIAGIITMSTASPQKIEIGQVKIDASTFKTDIPTRDENVKKLVLKSDQSANQFIVFTPTNITGVPEDIAIGKNFPISIIGDMVIIGTTKQVTFNGTANWSIEDALTIDATTTLTYGDFGITIPDFSFLANVDKNVKLIVRLVAR